MLGHRDQAGVGLGGGPADLLEVVELERGQRRSVAVEHVDDALADRDRAGGDQGRLGAPVSSQAPSELPCRAEMQLLEDRGLVKNGKINVDPDRWVIP